ncbi:MAG: CBS domain-containing protein [Myxococcota bacterium]
MKRNVPVTTIMATHPSTVHPGQRLSDARQAMVDGGFHHLPVVRGTKLIGVLSSTDLLKAAYTFGTDPRQSDAVMDHTLSIEQLMTKEPVFLRSSDPIRSAVEKFAEGRFHALPVVDADDNLVGVVTTTDVMRYVLEQY